MGSAVTVPSDAAHPVARFVGAGPRSLAYGPPHPILRGKVGLIGKPLERFGKLRSQS